jgi:hypothetical protein
MIAIAIASNAGVPMRWRSGPSARAGPPPSGVGAAAGPEPVVPLAGRAGGEDGTLFVAFERPLRCEANQGDRLGS